MHERASFNVYTQLENILETLANFGVHATFFITGEMAERHPGIPQTICKKDHEIASHGYSHKSFFEASYPEAEKEIAESIRVLSKFQEIQGFRAPYLVRNKATYLACEKLGLSYDSSEHGLRKYCPAGFKVTVLPVIAPSDVHGLDRMRLKAKDLVAMWVLNSRKSGGSAVCMHPWRMGRRRYVKALLEPLLRSNLSFVTASELVDRSGIALTFDVEYTSLSDWLPQNFLLSNPPELRHSKGLVARDFLKR